MYVHELIYFLTNIYLSFKKRRQKKKMKKSFDMVLPSTRNKTYSQTVKLYNLPTFTSVISRLSMSLKLHNLIRIQKNQHMYCQNKLCHLVNQTKRQLLNSSDIRSHSKNKIVQKNSVLLTSHLHQTKRKLEFMQQEKQTQISFLRFKRMI